jgi:transglutaminase-like putative cysteine protease
MNRNWRLAMLAVFGFWLAALSVRAQETPADNSGSLLDRKEALAAAAEVTREKYPNADDVLVDDYTRTVFQTDGTYESWNDCYQKILTEKGRRDAQTLSFYFTLPYTTEKDIGVTLLEIVKPNGDLVKLGAEDMKRLCKVMIDPNSMKSNIYNPNSKILKVGVPAVAVGDVVHYIYFRRVVQPRVKNSFSDLQLLEYTSPIRRMVYEILGPNELPLKGIALKDEIKGTVVSASGEKDGLRHYRWEARDVPRMFEEPDMPNLVNVVQRLLVSTEGDWKDVSRWYWKLSEPHFLLTPEIETKTAELVNGLQKDSEKMTAIFQWVSQQIRYAGITVEKDSPGYEPHDVGMTFSKRYGVCRDKAALLVAMLRAAGFKAFPVLIHNGPKKDVEVAMPYFNHAITAVELPGGEYRLMDSTDENTRNLLPEYLNDKSYLVARPEGETLRTTPIIPATENLMRIETEGKVDAQGKLSGKTVLSFDGQNDNSYRGFFAQSRPDKRRRYFEGIVKFAVPGAKLTGCEILPEDMQNVKAPLEVRLFFQADSVLVCGEDGTKMLSLPSFGSRIGAVNWMLRKLGLAERRYPLETDTACGVREKISLRLDPALGAVVAMPDYPKLESDNLLWQRKTRQEGEYLISEAEFLLKAVKFAPKDYLALKDAVKEIEYQSRRMPVLRADAGEMAASDADVLLLSEKVSYALKDVHNWSETRAIKKKILTYKGKKDHSRISLEYNSAWEKIYIEKAQVTDAKGNVKTISNEEVNVMDAPWVGSAPRYPASRTLVALLPGVEIGSVVEYVIRRECSNRPFFAAMHSFRFTYPALETEVVVSAPENLDYIEYLRDEGKTVSVESKKENGLSIRTWKALNQPGINDEGASPPWWSCNPTLFLSCGDWRGYSRELLGYLVKAASHQELATNLGRKLASENRDLEKRLIAIRDYVAREIRLAGPLLNRAPLDVISPADVTLHDGYGNNVDQAVLLYALLRAAGFRAEFVAEGLWERAPELAKPFVVCPDSLWLSGLLVRVELSRGREVYLNNTSIYAALGATPAEGRPGVVLDTGKVERILSSAGPVSRRQAEYLIDLDSSGDAHITRKRSFYGQDYEKNNRLFAEMTPEEQKRYHQEAVAAISQSAEPDGDIKVDFSHYPGTEELSVKVKRFAISDGNYLHFQLPESLENLFRLWADSRQTPYLIAETEDVRIDVTVNLPEGYRCLAMPTELHLKLPQGIGEVGIVTKMTGETGQGKTVKTAYAALVPPQVVETRDYAKLLDLCQSLTHPETRTFLLEKIVEPR